MTVSTEHEQLVGLFRDRKELLAELLADLGIEVVGEGEPEGDGNDLNQPKAVQASADLVQLFRKAGEVVEAAVVEVQLRVAPRKRRRWPMYATTLGDRHDCQVRVVVVAPDAKVADWAREPIRLGGGNEYRVTVLGPTEIPRPSSSEEPVERLLLALRVHPDADAAQVALGATNRLPVEDRADYIDAVLDLLPEAVRQEVIEMVTTRKRLYPQTDFAREHYGKGLIEALLRVLGRRFGELSAETVERVRTADGDQVLIWLDRSLDVATLEAVFAEPPPPSE
ncbi:MAG: hypothetical protein AAFU79_21480 [Myxococcota bacterium]